MITELSVKNYKSILDHTIQLGRFNVFIGENGCGKTNLLEALAMASASLGDKLEAEELYSKGIRIAKPSITFSSFLATKQAQEITLKCAFTATQDADPETVLFTICSQESRGIDTKWIDKASIQRSVVLPSTMNVDEPGAAFVRLLNEYASADSIERAEPIVSQGQLDFTRVMEVIKRNGAVLRRRTKLASQLGEFVIYNLSLLALRGIQPSSRKTPLGIYGENLDVLISTFNKGEAKELLDRAKVITWLDKVLVDAEDVLKFKGYKLGRSTSTLYFRDRFMRRGNNIFSAENANEGILHILFYLALFISKKTPAIFGIDNIETALNPQLCRDLTKELAALAKKNGKQALVTTHNPAILDGLDLHDDDQRLFVVYRNDHGHTVTKRIKLKPEAGGEKHKLSELWMRGHLGGLPRRF